MSSRLTDAYSQLEQQVAALNLELARSRQGRLNERAQKEHLADQLGVLLEALPAAVVLIDVRDRVDRFNPAAEQLFPGVAWGRRWAEVQQDAVAAETSPGTWRLKDGRRVNVSKRPLQDRGCILVLVDVSDQCRLQERVERQDRLGAMGEMAARLAHEINQPLNVLQVTLPTNFKVAPFADDAHTEIMRQMERDIEALRFGPDGYLFASFGDEGPQDDGSNNSQRIDPSGHRASTSV